MALVLDTSALIDMNFLNEDDPRYRDIAHKTENDNCYVTPIVAAQVCFRLRKDLNVRIADDILAMMRSGQWITIAEDSDIVELASEAMELGAVPSAAFTAALARKHDASVVVGDSSFDNLQSSGFCSILRY